MVLLGNLQVWLWTYRQQWSDPAVAVSAGAADRPTVQWDYRMDDTRWWVQVTQCRDSRTDVGSAQEQTHNELREVVSCPTVLLRQRYDHKGMIYHVWRIDGVQFLSVLLFLVWTSLVFSHVGWPSTSCLRSALYRDVDVWESMSDIFDPCMNAFAVHWDKLFLTVFL